MYTSIHLKVFQRKGGSIFEDERSGEEEMTTGILGEGALEQPASSRPTSSYNIYLRTRHNEPISVHISSTTQINRLLSNNKGYCYKSLSLLPRVTLSIDDEYIYNESTIIPFSFLSIRKLEQRAVN